MQNKITNISKQVRIIGFHFVKMLLPLSRFRLLGVQKNNDIRIPIVLLIIMMMMIMIMIMIMIIIIIIITFKDNQRKYEICQNQKILKQRYTYSHGTLGIESADYFLRNGHAQFRFFELCPGVSVRKRKNIWFCENSLCAILPAIDKSLYLL